MTVIFGALIDLSPQPVSAYRSDTLACATGRCCWYPGTGPGRASQAGVDALQRGAVGGVQAQPPRVCGHSRGLRGAFRLRAEESHRGRGVGGAPAQAVRKLAGPDLLGEIVQRRAVAPERGESEVGVALRDGFGELPQRYLAERAPAGARRQQAGPGRAAGELRG